MEPRGEQLSSGTVNSNSGIATGGSVNNSGNISQTVHVPGPSKASTTISIVVPLLAALISGIGGAYAASQFSLMNAPARTKADTSNLLGLVRETIEIANAKQAPPEISDHLKQIEQQARAVEAGIALLQRPAGVASGQADFWLRRNSAVTLGKTISFGVNNEANGTLLVSVNGIARNLPAGGRVDFKTDTGKKCFATYTGKSPDGSLYGFKTECAA